MPVQRSKKEPTRSSSRLIERELQIHLDTVEGGPLVRMSAMGPEIMCPGCEAWEPFMRYVPLQLVQKYARYLLPVLKCRSCHHVFALNPVPEVAGGEEELEGEGDQAEQRVRINESLESSTAEVLSTG